jgi:NADPH2:quinone reductase
MPHAIRIYESGGPEKLRWEEVRVAEPGPGEVLVRNTAVGLNFADTYHRRGVYYPKPLPFTPGMEGAGIIEQIGPKVREFKIGDRVAYAQPIGAYADILLRPVDRLVKIPAGIDERIAAAIMLKGTTAWYLCRRTYKVKEGDTVLVHAAAGGVGQILCQWISHLGAMVIGTVGGEEKTIVARKAGCTHVIVSGKDNVVERVKEITRGQGVPVVYDGVGEATFMASLDCLAPMGLMVNFGNASGAVTQFNPAILAQKGSLFFTRPTLLDYTAKRQDLIKASSELFAAVKKDAIRISINQTYPLSEAAQAHRDLESRKTTGSTLLLP